MILSGNYTTIDDTFRMYSQRRKIKPTRRSVSGQYPFRGETSIPYESTLERDFLIIQEADRFVTQILPQPVQLSYVHANGNTYRYTPDYLVFRSGPNSFLKSHSGKPELVEVKPTSELKANLGKMRLKFKAATQFAKQEGFIFRIYDERRIRTPMLKNLEFLNRYRRFPFTEFDPVELKKIVEVLMTLETPSIDELLAHERIQSQEFAAAKLWHLIATNTLSCDLCQPLTPHSRIWVDEYE